MKTGIALIGAGAGAAGVWQAMCAMRLPALPLMATDETALPLLCRLLCQKYHLSPVRRRRIERGGAAAKLELLKLARWLKKNSTAEPLKPGPLLFFFSGSPILICAPGTDVYLSGRKRLCRDDRDLLLNVMHATCSQSKTSCPRVWPLCAAGAEKTVAVLLNVPEQKSDARVAFWVRFSSRKPECAAEDVFLQLWQRRMELYDALLF